MVDEKAWMKPETDRWSSHHAERFIIERFFKWVHDNDKAMIIFLMILPRSVTLWDQRLKELLIKFFGLGQKKLEREEGS